MSLYRGAVPRAARCGCGGVFQDVEKESRKGTLPTGDAYHYVVAVSKACVGCGRVWTARKPEAVK